MPPERSYRSKHGRSSGWPAKHASSSPSIRCSHERKNTRVASADAPTNVAATEAVPPAGPAESHVVVPPDHS